ncbi:hypothetical protein BDF20DRAFT_832474 [Mycotypha africana]|uniref:uncharacterized protein n=1 Tax=Mycotypha africana TaxID=64632 RepID=UPI002301E43B|nr:uncharacterized protein BDF20DRAFT_832474 [Mycotypha africana]KAI8987555.1 hypothetical protein BDF20DRAFT_832474 [Mycotypha africana]
MRLRIRVKVITIMNCILILYRKTKVTIDKLEAQKQSTGFRYISDGWTPGIIMYKVCMERSCSISAVSLPFEITFSRLKCTESAPCYTPYIFQKYCCPNKGLSDVITFVQNFLEVTHVNIPESLLSFIEQPFVYVIKILCQKAHYGLPGSSLIMVMVSLRHSYMVADEK